MGWCEPITGGVELQLKVVPGASRSRVVGLLGNALKIQVAAPAEKGKANAAVIELLARTLRVGLKEIELVRGESQPRKTVRVRGISVDAARAALDARRGSPS